MQAQEAAADVPRDVQARPVLESERIDAIDVLRGFAIFGIFMVNIGYFAMPMTAVEAFELDREGPWNAAAYAVVQALFEMKFFSLFSFLFGVGVAIQYARARARGISYSRYHLVRMGALFGFGAIHGFLIWFGDILLLYSLVGFASLFIVTCSTRMLFWIAGGVLALATLTLTAFIALALIPQPPAEIPTPDPDATAMERFYGALGAGMPGGDFSAAERIAYGEGPYPATLIMRSIYFAFGLLFNVLSGFGIRVAGMFVLGMAAYRAGLFTDAGWPWAKRMLTIGLPVGLLGEGFGIVVLAQVDFNTSTLLGYGAVVLQMVFSLFLCLGYIGAGIALMRAGGLGILTRGLAAVGRTALSNYILQSVVATTVMYWYGFGQFDQWSRVEQLLFVPAVFVIQVLLSLAWLSRFRFGPLEWVWRSITYGRFQPVRARPSGRAPSPFGP